MYRKVHNTMMAFSATGMLLLVGLMAGVPAMHEPQSSLPLVRTVAVGPLVLKLESASMRTIEAREKAIEARAEVLEAQIEVSASTADALSHVAAFATTVAAETAFLAALTEDPVAPAAVENQTDYADQRQTQRRHARRAREALALPYFSFAQGLRRNRS